MNVGELFFQAALINFSCFAWIACAASSIKILFNSHVKISTAVFAGIFFAPLTLAFAFFYQYYFAKKTHVNFLGWRSPAYISISGLLTFILFYFVFVKSSFFGETGDSLVPSLFLFSCCAGFLGGIFLSALTKKVSFFEGCWAVFFTSIALFFLKNWADNSFSYGTSLTYFSTLLIFLSAIFLLFIILGGSLGYLFFGEGRANFNIGYESFIGLRFLMTKRSSHVVSLITIISIIAVTVSCAGMIVVMSVMNGFTDSLRSKILGANAHLMVMKYGNDFSEHQKIVEKTKDIEGIAELNPFIVNEGMISSERNLSGAMIIGLDLKPTLKSEHLLNYVSKESLEYLLDPSKIPSVRKFAATDKNELQDLPGVILGKEMAFDLGILVGDVVNLISPVGDIGPTGPIPKAKTFKVCGLFYSGMYEYDAKFAYVLLKEAQDFFNLKNKVSGVEYRLTDVNQTRNIAKKISDAIGGYPFYIRDWMQMNRNMFSALQLEKIAMLIILGTMIFMASLLILVALIMVVMEKGKEISILKSMGATDVSIMKIFVTYGLTVGGLGALFGGFCGFILCQFVEKVGISIDPDIYYFSSLPIKIVTSEVFLVIFAAILISFLATIPPALFAARLKPVEGLRYE